MTKRITTTVSDAIFEDLKGMSEDYGMSVSAIVSVAIMTYFEQKKAMLSLSELSKMAKERSDS